MVIPATINTHTPGSAIKVTILSLSTLLASGQQLPTFVEFIEFGAVYALAKFAVAAVPGGAIIVVTPLLESYLHFSTEMVGIMTAFYMLFDPVWYGDQCHREWVFPDCLFKALQGIELPHPASKRSQVGAQFLFIQYFPSFISFI